MINYKELGNRIRMIREAENISQEMLAEWAEIGPSTLSRIENGHTKIQLETLWRIASVLQVSVSDLLQDTKGPSKAQLPQDMEEKLLLEVTRVIRQAFRTYPKL